MIKLNVTLHEMMNVGEKQGSQSAAEQTQQSPNSKQSKGKSTVPFTALFKEMSHALYLWMD